MKSRGFVYAMGAGARKSLVLFWTAVLLCSALLQYAVIAAPPAVLAVHDDGLFELDGNVEGSAAPGDDWNTLFNGGGSADDSAFIADPINGNADKYFTGGDTKDIADIPSWLWTTVSQPQDKNDIAHAYAASYLDSDSGNTIVYFGLDRYASNGAAQVGFWFLQDDGFGLTGGPAAGGFSGKHVEGDVLVQIDFENGGANPVLRVYEWHNGALGTPVTGGSCATAAANDTRCAIAATSSTNPAWTFDDKGVAGADNDIPAGGMVEGGIDLTALGLDDGCFNSFVAETRSSPSADSTLSDFALGAFSLCAKPDIETHVRQGDTNVSTINKGESVTDVATLTGDKGPVTGSVEFFTCFDADAKPDCSSGGTSRGTKTLSGGSATSDAFTPANIGYYCFRVEYTPAANSKYFATSHTNKTTECVQVIPAEIDLVKTHDAASVTAGSPIGFTLSITSKGPGSAFGVKVSDTLPTKSGLDWSIDAAGTTGTWVIDSGVLKFGGADGVTMAKDAEFHVHVTSPTTPATCGTVNNTGNATTTNDGTDSDSASVEVKCPDVKVTKTPDGGTINAGDTATFSIKVENIGTGTAKNVSLSDNLPGTTQVHWTESEADCSISGADGSQVLTCSAGDLAAGASKTYTVSADLSGQSFCAKLDNTATATADNEPASDTANNTDSGDITVQCASIDIEKVADDGSVSAGDKIGFTITVTSGGPGVARDVTVTDTLPTDAGTSWTIDGGADQAQCAIAAGVLSCSFGDMAKGAEKVVHISSPTTKATVVDSPVTNTAHVSTSNDGSDDSTDHVDVLAASIDIEKVHDAASVSAGEAIGFTITVTSGGPGTAKDVTVNDPLPTDAGTSWAIDGGTAQADCAIAAGTLTCDLGDLASGQVRTVHISSPTTKATVADSPVTNTASVTTSNDGSDEDTDDVVVLGASIDIEKVADDASVTAGDPIGFLITVTSGGPGVAKDVAVTDTLPTDAGTSWTIDGGTAAADCGIAAGVLSCDLGDLAQGETRTVHISSPTTKATVADSPVSNTAHVATSNDGSDDDTDHVVVVGPDVVVDKNADNSPISAGDKAAFTIKVSNEGDGIARDVTLTDTLPAGIDWTTDSDGCAIESGVLSCSFGDLAPDAFVIVKVSGETDVADCGTIPNTASAAATNEPADRLANNEDSASIIVNCPAVAITKTPVDPEVNATDQIAFDIVVTNTGDGNAFNVTVSDTLPTDAGLSWSIDAANSDAGWSIDGAGVLHYGPATLASKASVKVRIVSPTTAATCPSVHNVADLTYTGGNGSDDGDITVSCPDVTVTKTADDSPISAGEKAAFTITVENIGEGVAYDVTLNDPLPTGVTWTEDSDDCSIAGGILSCSFGDLDPAAVRTIHVSGDTTAASCGALVNTATAAADNEGSDVLANNTDGDTVQVDCADVSITKTAVDGEVNATDQIAFDIVVTNGGDGTAFNVAVNDPLPVVAGVTWSIDAANSSAGWSISNGSLVYGPATLASGASVHVRITSPTTAASCGDIDNTAHVTFDGGEDQAGDSIVVDCPDVVIEKTADDSPILAGQVASFTISAWNEGTGTAYDVVITDQLPAGIDWTADNEACDIAQGVLTCNVGTLAPTDEPFTVTVRGTSDGEACADIPNQATVSAGNEPEDATENNTDGAQIDVQCASISLVKTAGNAADGAILTIPAPGNVTFTYVVTNTGTATLTGLHLVDDDATPANTADDVTVTCPKTTLAPGESVTCTATLAVTGTGITRTNVAVVTAHPELDSESTVTAHDDAVVKVPAPVVTPRPTPRITPPPTSTLDEGTQSSGGTGLLLVLLGITGLMLVLGYVMPAPAKARSRRRNGRG